MLFRSKSTLEDYRPPAKLKISSLWASLMFCYVYGDYFGLFMPNRLAGMNAGKFLPLGMATPGVLLGVSAMMAVPSVMVFLSLVLPPQINRWLNMGLAVLYGAIMLMTMPDSPPFYIFFGVVEIGLTLTIIWMAWTWPKAASEERLRTTTPDRTPSLSQRTEPGT